MADPRHDSKDEIKVEDLLRLKKAERPDEAFWGQFDRELHQRMLQTLVKKDPWYVQLARGLSGRIAQTAAVAGAAALLAMVTVRPALLSWAPSSSVQVVEADSAPSPKVESNAVAVLAEAPIRPTSPAREASSPDYRMERITAAENHGDATYKREFDMDVLQVATNERADYSGDSAGSWPTFGSTGVASLVY